MFMHNFLSLLCKHFFIRILCATNSLKDIAFRYICLQSAASLFLSFCLSLSISLMLSLHMCSRRTKLLISHPHCSKTCVWDVGLFVCLCLCACVCVWVFKLPFWLQQGLSLNQNPTKKFEIWLGFLCSAVVGAITHTYTQSCGGNAIKERDACEAQQPQAQNWFTEWERKRSKGGGRGNTLDLGCRKHRGRQILRERNRFWAKC